MRAQLRSGPIGNLVVIGPCDAEWLTDYPCVNSENLVCLDPMPGSVPLLAEAMKEHKSTYIKPLILALKDKQRPYHVANFPLVAQLEQTDAVAAAFPGLAISRTLMVNTISPASVLGHCISTSSPNVLYISQLGLGTKEIAALLREDDDSLFFSDVYIRATTQYDIAPEHTVGAMSAFLSSCGYDLVNQQGGSDGFPFLHFAEGNMAQKLLDARRMIAKLVHEKRDVMLESANHKKAAAARTNRILELTNQVAELEQKLGKLALDKGPKKAVPRSGKTQKTTKRAGKTSQ